MDGNLAMANQFVDMSENDMNELHDYYMSLAAEKKTWQKILKGLINVTGLFRHLNENDNWTPVGIVDIYDVDEKKSGYSNYQFVRIKDDEDKRLYMKQPVTEIRNVSHNCVWQTVGMMGDDYSGYLLFPLSNGKYLKVSYSC